MAGTDTASTDASDPLAALAAAAGRPDHRPRTAPTYPTSASYRVASSSPAPTSFWKTEAGIVTLILVPVALVLAIAFGWMQWSSAADAQIRSKLADMRATGDQLLASGDPDAASVQYAKLLSFPEAHGVTDDAGGLLSGTRRQMDVADHAVAAREAETVRRQEADRKTVADAKAAAERKAADERLAAAKQVQDAQRELDLFRLSPEYSLVLDYAREAAKHDELVRLKDAAERAALADAAAAGAAGDTSGTSTGVQSAEREALGYVNEVSSHARTMLEISEKLQGLIRRDPALVTRITDDILRQGTESSEVMRYVRQVALER